MRFLTITHNAANLLRSMLVAGALMLAPAAFSQFTIQVFTSDANSGISASNTYTHAIDFAGPGETVNGVTFVAGGSGSQPGLNYTLSGTTTTFTGNSNTLSPGGAISDMFLNFFYGGTATLTLTGLTPGQTYLAAFYAVSFGPDGDRVQTVTDSSGNSILYDEDAGFQTGSGTILRDLYTPTGTSFTFTFTPTPATQGTYHFYGFSNQVVPEPTTWALMLVGGAGLVGALRCRQR